MLVDLRKMFYRARGYYKGQLAGESFRLDPYHSRFWRKASKGQWEPETFQVLSRYLNPSQDYLDIGAWIGPTVLYGARKARRVWCFEPDPTAFRALAWNIDMNQLTNVNAFAVALSQEMGMAKMASFRGEPGDSMTSLLNPQGEGAVEVLTICWDDFVAAADLGTVSLVKMDIEGAEYRVLPTLIPWLKEKKPALYLSTHAPYLDEKSRRDSMTRLAESLSFYKECLDESGRIQSPLEALTSPRALESFTTFLFRMGPL